jgi:hypothetical protein
MKFRTHTQFRAASIFDLYTATMQGGIIEISLGSRAYGAEWQPQTQVAAVQTTSTQELTSVQKAAAMASSALPKTGTVMLVTGSLFLILGLAALITALSWARRRRRRSQRITLNEPLVGVGVIA